MIHLNDIIFHYQAGDFHLVIPELSVEKGEKVAVIGPSGSGKTTLLNLVSGILVPQAGIIRVGDIEISKQDDSFRREYRITNIGSVFQDFGLIDYLDVMDNILHPYRITTALKVSHDTRNKARLYAEKMGIANRLDHHPADLSHGERQRAAICRALLPQPSILLADEATGNLDPQNKKHILKLLFQATEEHQSTLLAVTHDRDLLPFFDRVINFNDFLAGREL